MHNRSGRSSEPLRFLNEHIQKFAAEVKLTEGPQLFLMEDITGAGKTEAALILVQRYAKHMYAIPLKTLKYYNNLKNKILTRQIFYINIFNIFVIRLNFYNMSFNIPLFYSLIL